MRRTPLMFVLPLVFSLLIACDSGGGSYPSNGEVTLSAEQGVDFTSGRLQDPGNFKNSDLYATANGSACRAVAKSLG